MKLEFTNHAQSQVYGRSIAESRIADTIRNPDFISKAPGEAMRYRKKFDNGILEVICVRKSKNKYIILTAYYL